MGRFQRETSSPTWFYVLMSVLLAFVFLKGIGLITALTGIDPYGLTLNLDAGTLGLFVAFVLFMFDYQRKMRAVGTSMEEIARRVSALETARRPPWGS